MKYVFLTIIVAFSLACSDKSTNAVTGGNSPNVIQLNDKTFKQKVFNYAENKDWKFKGDKPAIIDFYADWCGPCREVSPIIEELAGEYSGKIVVYKVDTDVERELTQNIGIQNLPTILFIPLNGKPQVLLGAQSKSELLKAIHNILLVKK